MALSLDEYLEKNPVDMSKVAERKEELLKILEDYRNNDCGKTSDSSMEPIEASFSHEDLDVLFKRHEDDDFL